MAVAAIGSPANTCMSTEVSFGAWVNRRRKALGLTQEELAQRANCSVSAIRKIESDERRPSLQIAEQLAEGLHIPAGERDLFLAVARGSQLTERLGDAGASASSVPHASPAGGLKSNLPSPATPLVGREAELAALRNLLHAEECRLLTLTGPGGIGKTRLALHVIHDAAHEGAFVDGVHFVSLAPVHSPEFMISAIADAIGQPLSGRAEPRHQLLDRMRGKQMLLLLDSLEHLLDGVSLIADMAAVAPTSKYLATSRERLSLHGEWVFELQGLPMPATEHAAHVEQYSAVALFVQCAHRADQNFELTDDDRPSVVRICHLVEGVPLAIELAAAWVRVLSCREIAQEIERDLDFLTATMRDVPPRHRSLRAVFDHSWRLLTDHERDVLRRLSVFHRGFTREAAELVAGASLADLSSLVARSVLRRTSAAGRYDLHELMQQYAAGRLQESGEAEADQTRRRHADYCLALAQQADAALDTPEQRLWFERLEAEHDNLRAAARWSLDSGQAVLAVSLCGALSQFWHTRGYVHEGRRWLGEALALARRQDGMPKAALAKALAGAGVLAWVQLDSEQAKAFLAEALALQEELGDKRGMTGTLYYLGTTARIDGDFAQALAHHEASLALRRELGDDVEIARALNGMAWTMMELNDLDRAHAMAAESLQVYERMGDPMNMALVLDTLGWVDLLNQDHENAMRHFQRSLALAHEVGVKRCIIACLEGLSVIAARYTEFGRAARLLGAAEVIRQEIGSPLDPTRKELYARTVCAVRALAGLPALQAAIAEARVEGVDRVIDEVLAQQI